MIKEKPKKAAGVNVGSISLFMVFAVLCLTIFSALSLVTATNELKIAQRFQKSIENYYMADLQAVEIIEKLGENEEVAGVTILDGVASFMVPIDDRQGLEVEAKIEENKITILSWVVKDSQFQILESTIPVWSGEEGVFQ